MKTSSAVPFAVVVAAIADSGVNVEFENGVEPESPQPPTQTHNLHQTPGLRLSETNRDDGVEQCD